MPGLSVGIRRATINDVAELNHVRAMAIGSKVAREDLRTRIDAANVFTYLAEEDTPFGFVTVGTAEALVQPAEALDDATGEILEWYLRPEFWQGRDHNPEAGVRAPWCRENRKRLGRFTLGACLD